MKNNYKPKIGFIGQGWIGKNYADSFEDRGFEVIRYSQEAHYLQNKEKIAECDVVFIAVPTPTTQGGFDSSIVRSVMKAIGKGKIAVIKSTILPGTTNDIQKENPEITVLNSPEFLSEATARHDADYPMRNIVGIPVDNEIHKKAANLVLSILPKAPYERICTSVEAELIKYGANNLFYIKIVYMNILYDLAQKYGADWKVLKDAFVSNPWMGTMHSDPVHKTGRGAGGNCFIKDFAAFRSLVEDSLQDKPEYKNMLRGIEDANLDLLLSTNKDIKIIESVYGSDHFKKQ